MKGYRKRISSLFLLLLIFVCTIGIVPVTNVKASGELYLEFVDDYSVSQGGAQSFFAKIDSYNTVTSDTGSTAYVFGLTTTNTGMGSTAYYNGGVMGSGYSYLVFNESYFTMLSSTKQSKLLSALVDTAIYDKLNTDSISKFVDIITYSGADGTALMNILFGKSKPSFGSAYKIFAPFNGPLGTVLGVIVLAFGAGLVLMTLSDIFAIGIPPYQKLAYKDGQKTFLITTSAINAIKKGEAEGVSSWKIVGSYLVDRSLVLLLIGLCLLYLVSGKIFSLIGVAMDSANGFK